MWRRGETIVVRYRSRDDGFSGALPVRVIEDRPEQVVVFLAENSEVARPVLADGRELRDVPLEERWSHPRRSVRRLWQRSDLVMIFPRRRRHSLWVFHESGRHIGWYVNLEELHEFAERTITTQDGILDISILVESGEPKWKDEDEFATAIEAGVIGVEEAAALRAEGERVLTERPWPTGWEGWQPPVDWTPLRLPPEWESMP